MLLPFELVDAVVSVPREDDGGGGAGARNSRTIGSCSSDTDDADAGEEDLVTDRPEFEDEEVDGGKYKLSHPPSACR